MLAQAEGIPLGVAGPRLPLPVSDRKGQQARTAALTEVLELAGGRSLTVEAVPLSSPGASGGEAQPTRAAAGVPMLFVIRDETARRNTDRMRRDFATNVSHELKTPLAGLSLLAETLRDTVKEDPEQAEKFVARLSKEIGRLTELTNDLSHSVSP